MKIKSFLIRSFAELGKPVYTIQVPEGSKYLDCKVIPDGVAVWYEVPNEIVNTKTEKFKIISSEDEVPENGTFLALLDVLSENKDKEQIVIILPVYKIL